MENVNTQAITKKPIELFRLFLYIGLGIIVFYYLPYIAAGENAHILIFDNLDSEILFYKLSAKYLFNFNGVIPEVMNGLPIGSVNVFSPIQTLVYMILPTYWAYMFNDFWVKIIGFLGLYFLSNRILNNKFCFISFLTSTIFALLPVYSVYGLSIYGQPILILAVWNLYKKENKLISYLLIALFGVSSSLILTGYYLLAFFGLFCLVVTIKKGLKNTYHLWLGLITLTLIFLLTNSKMIYMTLFDGYVSMRTERIERSLVFMNRLTSTDFFSEVFVMFFSGQVHAVSGHIYSYFALLPMIVFAVIKNKNNQLNDADKKYIKIVIALIIYNFACALINGLYYTKPVNYIIERLGPLRGFQFHRMFLSYAITWAVIFSISLSLLKKWGVFEKIIEAATQLKKPVRIIVSTVLCMVISFSVLGVYEGITHDVGYYETIGRVFYPNEIQENNPTFKQYVGKDVFDSIKNHIGKDVKDYKVVSLGIYPAAASMNGFYTLDGFFQNYPLEYKHDFRKIIAGELEKSEHLREYFDYWGNKCYILTSEFPKEYKISKNADITIQNLEIDTAQLKAMGGDYIFSALPINNFEELSLTFEGNFDTPTSFWRIYLYKVS